MLCAHLNTEGSSKDYNLVDLTNRWILSIDSNKNETEMTTKKCYPATEVIQ